MYNKRHSSNFGIVTPYHSSLFETWVSMYFISNGLQCFNFVTNCQMNAYECQKVFTKISLKFPAFTELNTHEKFIYHISCKDRQILMWFGKFLYNSFDIRNTKSMGRACSPNSDILPVSTYEVWRDFINYGITLGSHYGPLFTKKTPSYQYRDSHYKPETVVRPS